jgi:hypothetical protein
MNWMDFDIRITPIHLQQPLSTNHLLQPPGTTSLLGSIRLIHSHHPLTRTPLDGLDIMSESSTINSPTLRHARSFSNSYTRASRWARAQAQRRRRSSRLDASYSEESSPPLSPKTLPASLNNPADTIEEEGDEPSPMRLEENDVQSESDVAGPSSPRENEAQAERGEDVSPLGSEAEQSQSEDERPSGLRFSEDTTPLAEDENAPTVESRPALNAKKSKSASSRKEILLASKQRTIQAFRTLSDKWRKGKRHGNETAHHAHVPEVSSIDDAASIRSDPEDHASTREIPPPLPPRNNHQAPTFWQRHAHIRRSRSTETLASAAKTPFSPESRKFARTKNFAARLLPSIADQIDPPLHTSKAEQLATELIHMIYYFLSPFDFNAARHSCLVWMNASLDVRLLSAQLKRGGW